MIWECETKKKNLKENISKWDFAISQILKITFWKMNHRKMYKFPYTETTKNILRKSEKIFQEKLLQIQIFAKLNIFSRTDESKNFCEIKFRECTKSSFSNEKKMQDLTLAEDRSTIQNSLRDKLLRIKNFKTFTK